MESKDMNVRLNVISWDDVEMPIDSFVKEMTKLIREDVEKNYVIHSKDDDCDDNDYYEVRYKGINYKIKYGDKKLRTNDTEREIISRLELLVDLSEIQNKTHKDELSSMTVEEIRQRKIMEKAKEKIIDSNKEKENEIANLIEKDQKNKTNIIKKTLETLKYMNVPDRRIWEPTSLRLIVGVLAISIFLTHFITEGIPVFVAWICGFLTIDGILWFPSMITDFRYRGLVASLASIISAPFILGYNLCARLIEKIKLKLGIKNIKKTIVDVKKIEKKRNANDENKKGKTKDIGIKELNKVQEKLMAIQNSADKDEYTNNLKEIAKYYLESLESLGKDKAQSILKDQIDDLMEEIRQPLQIRC